MKSAGVDGCHKGWFIVSVTQSQDWEFRIFSDIKALWKHNRDSSLILIDIPIGLPHSNSRLCDREARKLLKKRGASVFPAPSREAILAVDYQKACEANKRILGKKISIQAWNISVKIKEVDELLCYHRAARMQIRESHPEICFWALTGGRSLSYSKRNEAGMRERLAVLQKICPGSETIFYHAIKKYARQDLAKDDILDAIALAITASSLPATLCTVPKNPARDKQNLPMEIVYTDQYFY